MNIVMFLLPVAIVVGQYLLGGTADNDLDGYMR